MLKIYEDNPELTRIAIVAVAASATIIAVIALFATAFNKPSTSFYDEYSEQEISSIKTGGGYDVSGANLIGFNLLAESGLSSSEIMLGAIDTIKSFIDLTRPDISTVSLIKKSIEKNNNIISFRLHANTSDEYNCQLEDYGNSQYAIKISDKNNLILDYDTAKIYSGVRNPKTLAQKYLPYTIRQESPAITLVKDAEVYKILVSSCDDEKVKQEARNITEAWLKSYNFDPNDFNLEIPTICDREVEHI